MRPKAEKFKALSRIKSGGRIYEPGETLELDDERDIARLRVAPVNREPSTVSREADAGDDGQDGADEPKPAKKKAAKKKAAKKKAAKS